ncbi:MAG: GNAT family N-acetyltransferase [Deltaproteobacteria bacterium]|nr:GNAT family N-acetyltransferase [Deltaproteobacteria bacterium]
MELPEKQNIRMASEKDLPRIMEIERQSFIHQWDRHNFKEALRDCFFVFEDEKVEGFLVSCCCEVANKAIILKIAVDPESRGKGVASQLLTAALDYFKGLKIDSIEIDVDVIKAGVIRLYEKFGFKVMRILAMDPEMFDDDELCMMKLNLNDK